MTTSLTAPPTAAERVRQAVDGRPSTDYIFHFWTALGWTVLTFGIYWFYAFYQLIRRSREHNRRRVALLQAAHDLAWERAAAQGRTEPLRPTFDGVRDGVGSLQAMLGDLRDPTLWLVLSVVGQGLVWLAGALLLDQDLVQHERHERAAEAGLTSLFSELGTALPAPVPATKQPHNYVGRILAVVCSFGLYSLWWVADLMREGNANFEVGYPWEDALARSLGAAA
jgi:hypothetical protein